MPSEFESLLDNHHVFVATNNRLQHCFGAGRFVWPTVAIEN